MWKPAESAVLQPRCVCIEDPVVIGKILNHLQEKSAPDAGKIPGVLGMQNVLNGVSLAVGVMESSSWEEQPRRCFTICR